MGSGRLRAAASVAALASLVARDAHSGAALRFTYVRKAGAESCPDEAAVRAAVATRLGYDPFSANASAEMSAEVSREGKGFRARIQLVDSAGVVRGTRELGHAGAKCADMIDTVALSISIAIDPESLAGPSRKEPVDAPSPEGASPAEREPEPEPKPRAPALQRPASPADKPALAPFAPRPARREASLWHVEAGLGPSIWIGAAPAPNLGAHLFSRVRRGPLSLALEGRADLPASRALPSGEVGTSLFFGSLVPCLHAGWLVACGVAAAGSIRATSHGVPAPRSDAALHAALGPRVAVDVPLAGSLSLWAHAGGMAILTPQVLTLGGAPVYEVPRFSVGAGGGASFRFF